MMGRAGGTTRWRRYYAGPAAPPDDPDEEWNLNHETASAKVRQDEEGDWERGSTWFNKPMPWSALTTLTTEYVACGGYFTPQKVRELAVTTHLSEPTVRDWMERQRQTRNPIQGQAVSRMTGYQQQPELQYEMGRGAATRMHDMPIEYHPQALSSKATRKGDETIYISPIANIAGRQRRVATENARRFELEDFPDLYAMCGGNYSTQACAVANKAMHSVDRVALHPTEVTQIKDVDPASFAAQMEAKAATEQASSRSRVAAGVALS